MNIQDIQIARGFLRTIEERSNAGKGNVSSPDKDISVHQVKVTEGQDKTIFNSKISKNEDPLAVVYPPFFPIGNTQDILSIKAVNLAGDDIKEKLSLNEGEQKTDWKKETSLKETKANASHLHNITQNFDQSVESNNTKHAMNPGDVLDLKV